MLTTLGNKKKTRSKKPVTKALNRLAKSASTVEVQDSSHQREAQILAKYISRQQEHNRLPRHIPSEYKMKLLLPLALHENDVQRLGRIQAQLSKGPPKCFVTSTAAGSGKIWFVRSAVNKGKRQSKQLGIFLRYEKKQAQKRLNHWENCKENANWALHEAIWEQCLEDQTFPRFAPEEYLRLLNFSLDDEQLPKASEKAERCPTKVAEWLQPIKDSMKLLAQTNSKKNELFRRHRNTVLLGGGQFQFYEKQGDKLYARRISRFENLVRNELPHVVPYIPGRDLQSLLNKYRL